MLPWHNIHHALQALCAHRMRTLLSTLGILFGVASVIAMLSIGEGAKQETLSQIEQLGINNLILRKHTLTHDQQSQGAYSKGLTEEHLEGLKLTIPSLQRYAPLKQVEASLNGLTNQIALEILAVTPSFGEIKPLSLAEGRFLCHLDQKEKKLVCVIGYEVAKALGREGHSGQAIRLDDVRYQIVGVLQATHWQASKNQMLISRNLDHALFIPLGTERTLPRALSAQDQGFHEVILQLQNAEQIPTSARLIRQLLPKLLGQENYQIIIPQELLQQAHQTHQTFNWVLGSIAAISLLVGGIGIMNIMLATVLERTREIGIRRAIGANKTHIMQQFLIETVLLTLVGALFGLIVGISSAYMIGWIAGWTTLITWWSLMLAVVMSILVGLLSGAYPAHLAASLTPLQALRHD